MSSTDSVAVPVTSKSPPTLYLYPQLACDAGHVTSNPFSVAPLATVPELPGLICSVDVDPQSTPSPAFGSKLLVVSGSALAIVNKNKKDINHFIVIIDPCVHRYGL